MISWVESVSVRPKPGFGIGNQNEGPLSVSVSEPIFFPKPKDFSHVSDFIQGYKFLYG